MRMPRKLLVVSGATRNRTNLLRARVEIALPVSGRHVVLRAPGFDARVRVHRVDGFKGESSRFVQEKVDDDGAEEVARGEDKAVAVLNVLDDERSEKREEETCKVERRDRMSSR